MRPHAANLQFASKARNSISFGDAPCSVCRANENLLHETHSFKMISQFGCRSPTFLHTLSMSPPAAIDVDAMPDCAVTVSPDEHVESRNQKLATVLAEWRVHDLNIKPHLKHALIGLIDRCLNAFAVNDEELAQTTVVEHSSNTGDAAEYTRSYGRFHIIGGTLPKRNSIYIPDRISCERPIPVNALGLAQ